MSKGVTISMSDFYPDLETGTGRFKVLFAQSIAGLCLRINPQPLKITILRKGHYIFSLFGLRLCFCSWFLWKSVYLRTLAKMNYLSG